MDPPWEDQTKIMPTGLFANEYCLGATISSSAPQPTITCLLQMLSNPSMLPPTLLKLHVLGADQKS